MLHPCLVAWTLNAISTHLERSYSQRTPSISDNIDLGVTLSLVWHWPFSDCEVQVTLTFVFSRQQNLKNHGPNPNLANYLDLHVTLTSVWPWPLCDLDLGQPCLSLDMDAEIMPNSDFFLKNGVSGVTACKILWPWPSHDLDLHMTLTFFTVA